MKNLKSKVITAIALIATLSFTALFTSDVSQAENEELYNNGVCTECNGSYEYTGYARTSFKCYYYYHCDNCGKIVVLRK